MYWLGSLCALVLIALALRLHGIGDPILDHPGWRQGDTAAIARNFYRLRYDIMYPQTMYNGPPPNYVELELQIVPFIVATLYGLFGVHEIFGRIVTLVFSLATVVTIAYFGRWIFRSAIAGFAAAFFYAIFPGSVYYGRTFMPDCAMVFFLSAALFAAAQYLVEDDNNSLRGSLGPAVLLTLAYLAKPVAALAAAPLVAMMVQRARSGGRVHPVAASILIAVPLLILALYDRRIATYAEWHWASGITKLHVLPSLWASLTSLSGLGAKLTGLRIVLGMLRDTMLGGISFGLAIIGFLTLPWTAARTKALLWGWLAGGLIYLYVVVTVERVDYYTYPLLPLCALVIGGAIARFATALRRADVAPAARFALFAIVPVVAIAVLLLGRATLVAYYDYNKEAYRSAVALDARLPQDALVVMGHYGPDVQYYVNRFGWEEDPKLWTPFDEESAIRKGARYFVAIEVNRLRENLELCAWLARFPLLAWPGPWPVYETDPSRVSAGADRFWREFRNAERAGAGRAFLDANGLCRPATALTIPGRS